MSGYDYSLCDAAYPGGHSLGLDPDTKTFRCRCGYDAGPQLRYELRNGQPYCLSAEHGREAETMALQQVIP